MKAPNWPYRATDEKSAQFSSRLMVHEHSGLKKSSLKSRLLSGFGLGLCSKGSIKPSPFVLFPKNNTALAVIRRWLMLFVNQSVWISRVSKGFNERAVSFHMISAENKRPYPASFINF